MAPLGGAGARAGGGWTGDVGAGGGPGAWTTAGDAAGEGEGEGQGDEGADAALGVAWPLPPGPASEAIAPGGSSVTAMTDPSRAACRRRSPPVISDAPLPSSRSSRRR